LQEALDDENVKAILCSRGGYGLAQIIDKLDFSKFVEHPKWLIGFSDVTILHNAINKLGIPSVHSVMAKHITELPPDAEPVRYLKYILEGIPPVYEIPSSPLNRKGTSKGKLIGGNLSVFAGLRATPYDLNFKGNILFIEDVDEQPYHIDRMMQNLRLSGVLSEVSGLIVGQFSYCEEDPRMKQTISEIIFDAVEEYDYPVCFNFPAGHVDYNLPLIMGCNIQLDVQSDQTVLKFIET